MFNFFIPTIRITENANNTLSALVKLHLDVVWRWYNRCYHNSTDTFHGKFFGSYIIRRNRNLHNVSGNVRLYGNRIGGTDNFFRPREEKQAQRPRLEVVRVYKRKGQNEVTIGIEIKNNGDSTAKDCHGTITIIHEKDDVLWLPHKPARIDPDHYAQVENAQMCWSVSGNASEVNIPKEMIKILEFVRLESTRNSWLFNFPSDEGYGHYQSSTPIAGTTSSLPASPKFSTVLMKAKKYSGTVMIGAEDTEPIVRKFTLAYDEQTHDALLELT